MRKLLFFLLVVIIFKFLGVSHQIMAQTGYSQPIEFSHKKHVDTGLPCDTCHQYFENHASAGMPELEVCMMCHTAALTESQEEEKIREFAELNDEIKWVRLYRVPDHVYFSHRRHVVLANLECSTCHGAIGESMKPPPEAEIELTMERCIACHQKMEADTDCYACHR